MKKFNELRKKHTFIVSVLLVIAIVGVAATVALAVASTDPVVNTFKAADLDTEIEEPTPSPDPVPADKKKVTIKNNGESAAFIRVRVTVSPEGAAEPSYVQKTNWYYGGDGFYYYLEAVQGNGETTPLFDGVVPSEEFAASQESFDVTVYQESCVATTDLSEYPEVEDKLEAIKAAFVSASGTTTESDS